MGLFVSNGRILGSQSLDSIKGEHFMRLLGGHVEFGERSDETLHRELMEETGAEITNLRLAEVVENVFVYEGKPGHEISFIYLADFVDPSYYTAESITVKDSEESTAVWVPASDVLEGKVRLYPIADYTNILKLATEQKQ
jgi:ADP-ribose pyrophosphatase YjhB (NUDIX family)